MKSLYGASLVASLAAVPLFCFLSWRWHDDLARQVREEVGRSLDREARGLLNLVDPGSDELRFDEGRIRPPGYAALDEFGYLMVEPKQPVALWSDSMGQEAPDPRPYLGPHLDAYLGGPHPRSNDSRDMNFDTRFPDQRPAFGYRYWTQIRHGQRYEPLIIVVLRDATKVKGALSDLLWQQLALGVVLFGAVAFNVATRFRAGLKPLDALVKRVARIDAESLDQPIVLRGLAVPKEIEPVVAKLEELRGRLSEGFAKERRFTAAAAHELRTPVAELKALAEVARNAPDDAALQARTVDDALAIAREMERLVATLLALHRGDTAAVPLEMEAVGLEALVAGVWVDLASRAAARQIRCEASVPASCSLRADRTLLRAIVANLIGNAIDHAPEGSVVQVAWDAGGNALSVANTAPGLVAEDLPRLFEPFWRKDRARTSGSEHLGLGLALAQSYAHLLGLEIAATLDAQGRLVMRLGPVSVTRP